MFTLHIETVNMLFQAYFILFLFFSIYFSSTFDHFSWTFSQNYLLFKLQRFYLILCKILISFLMCINGFKCMHCYLMAGIHFYFHSWHQENDLNLLFSLFFSFVSTGSQPVKFKIKLINSNKLLLQKIFIVSSNI